MAEKVWFITGISRGLSRSQARAALDRGDAVVGTTRGGRSDLAVDGWLTVLPLDVTNRAAVFNTVATAHTRHGRLDVVVNNAGFGLIGPVEASSSQEVHDVFAVNAFGPLRVVQAALPLLRQHQGGHLMNITFSAGLAPGGRVVHLRRGQVRPGRPVWPRRSDRWGSS